MQVDLPDDARVRDLTVTPHDLARYDALLDKGKSEEVGDDATS